HHLAKAPARSAVISTAYAAFVLSLECTGLMRLATITMQLEGGGRFNAANWNTDRCGLSFGLIQWAQKPGRLHELLAAWQRANPARFVEILGGGDAETAHGLLGHTAGPLGGIDRASGLTVDPRYDLIGEPWRSRFLAAGHDVDFQRVQVAEAL